MRIQTVSRLIQLKQKPVLERIIRVTGCRKFRAILADPTNNVQLSGTYWDEGSRTEYFKVCIKTGECTALPSFEPPNFGGPREAPFEMIVPGYAIVSIGTLNGKPALPTIYMNKEDHAEV